MASSNPGPIRTPPSRVRYDQQRHHFNVYYSPPISVSAHIQMSVRRWARALIRDGTVSDVGHSLFTAFDNRKQWEYTGEQPHWLKSWAWAVLRAVGGQVLRGLLTKQTPRVYRHPWKTLAIISACWALVNFSKDDMIFRLLQLQPFKSFMYGAEAFYASKEVQGGVDGFLEKMPDSHVSAIAMGIISGCGGTMLLNWARKHPLTKGEPKADWIVKTCFYAALVYAVPSAETKLLSSRSAKYLMRALFVWAYLWRAAKKVRIINGDIFRPVETVAWAAAKVASDVSDAWWHL